MNEVLVHNDTMISAPNHSRNAGMHSPLPNTALHSESLSVRECEGMREFSYSLPLPFIHTFFHVLLSSSLSLSHSLDEVRAEFAEFQESSGELEGELEAQLDQVSLPPSCPTN